MRTRLARLLSTTLVALSCASLPALSQGQDTYPQQQPVKIILGHQAGSAPDIVARNYADKLGPLLKQSVLVDNKTGAGAQIATLAVARAAPDGYTLLLGDVGSIAIAPAAYAKTLPYKPDVELRPVAELGRNAFVFVTSTKNGPKTLKQFLAEARNSPTPIPVGTSGPASISHFGGELFARAGGFKIEPVHYRNIVESLSAVVSGEIWGVFLTPALVAQHIRAGTMQAIAISSSKRSPVLPDVETFEQGGLPGVEFNAWLALFAPARTPDAIVDQVSQAVAKAAADDSLRTKLVDMGFEVTGLGRADATSFVKAEQARWLSVTKTINFKAD